MDTSVPNHTFLSQNQLKRLLDNNEALQFMSAFNVKETLKQNKSPGEIEKNC